MQHPYLIRFLILAFVIFPSVSFSQSVYQPYSYHFYQKLNHVLYSQDSDLHTAIKPLIIDSALSIHYDSLMNVGVKEKNSWVARKIFNEHLLHIKNNEYTFYADFIPDFQMGKDFANGGKNTWLNTRGYQVGGSIKDKFFFFSSGYENQAIFTDYIDDYVNENRIVPGQMFGKLGNKVQDWTYVTAMVSYSVSKKLDLSLAYDKNFIGDGYRSILLSDISSNSTSFKANAKLGKVNLLSIWSYMLDPRVMETKGTRIPSLHKYGSFQYADLNVNNRFSLGLFYSLLWGQNLKQNPDSNILEPIAQGGSASSMQIGLNSKYKVLKNTSLYGQLLINKEWATQIGVRGFDAFGIKRLNFLAEYNYAKPYSYTANNILTNYSNYSQPLAHPFGANFSETVGIVNYSYHKFDFSLQANYGLYGLDPNLESNFGKDIFKSNNENKQVGEELSTNLVYLDAKIAYVLNPKYNLRFEIGSTLRTEKNDLWKKDTQWLTLGFRASFRNLYYDF